MNREYILKLREKGLSYTDIGRKIGVTRQRIHQIIKQPSYTHGEKLESTLLSWALLNKKYPQLLAMGGRERTRELVRIRDKFRCRCCGKSWKKGKRRFDCHHIGGLCGKNSKACESPEKLPTMITLCHRCHFHQHDRSPNFEKSFKLQQKSPNIELPTGTPI